MDITSIIIVSLIVSAFVLFAAVLMWRDIATRPTRRVQANKAAQTESQPASPAVQHRDAA